MKIAAALFTFIFLSYPAAAQSAPPSSPPNPLAREIFQQLIEINTTDSVGNVTTAAEAMAVRLGDAGFPGGVVVRDAPNERKKNLVGRFQGTGQRKAILFIGHLDVVEARREDW